MTEVGGEDGLSDCWEGIKKWEEKLMENQWQSCGGWKPSTFCFSLAKKKRKVWGFFIVYYCCCCCLIQASPTTLIALSKAPLSAWKGSPCCSASSLVQYYHVLFYFSKEVRKRAFRFISGSEYLKMGLMSLWTAPEWDVLSAVVDSHGLPVAC